MEVKRLFDLPYYQNEKFPQKDALVDKVDGQWIKVSTQEYIDKANSVSRALVKLGIQPGDKIALISNNRSEWNICDIGIQQVGAISVPVYPTIDSESYAYIFNDAEVKLCIVSDQELADKVNAIINQVSTLQKIYSFVDVNGAENWTALQEPPNAELDAEVEKRKSEIKNEDLVTLIYTSGTTGYPKGVMLSHNNLLSNVIGCEPRLPVDQNAKALSFLPVCHVFERMLLYLYQYTGVSIYFAESLDTIGDDLKDVKPNVFTAVPRLLEKVFDKIVAKGEALTGIKKKLFFWALKLGEEYDVRGKSGFYKFKLGIARKLIFSKWQEGLGGNVEAIACGSAALQPRLARVYLAAGIPVMEGYGLTETSPVISVNWLEANKVCIGTTGPVIDKVTVKIADDGEILVKGPNVMMGYYNHPDKTKEVIDDEGWFHTGDIGTFVDGQYLKITDRKKEIFKTSGGKYIAPQVMENKFKESRFIEQIMVVGENRKMPTALIVPDAEYFKEWAKQNNLVIGDSYQEMIKNVLVHEQIEKEIEKYNINFGKWERIKKFEFSDHPWTIESGELTPTMKPKRKEINASCADLIEKMYTETGESLHGQV
ncbi:long-chain fatty acid--CoA ligase [Paracrocinitomix mangrovi]|uniref:AMP-dependent synthetase/ligase n=1 Tax=Paracrocinitomix mangrovi TaxID=2862509 RepID=UPI001C8DE3F7|nr:long-chain fatty acid--CoA ligase [Paracrocinitomix mangrovi]UKN01523.1 long-chain fatty acid--CoA ligase [Paracrocinitomix mangrovi]